MLKKQSIWNAVYLQYYLLRNKSRCCGQVKWISWRFLIAHRLIGDRFDSSMSINFNVNLSGRQLIIICQACVQTIMCNDAVT